MSEPWEALPLALAGLAGLSMSIGYAALPTDALIFPELDRSAAMGIGAALWLAAVAYSGIDGVVSWRSWTRESALRESFATSGNTLSVWRTVDARRLPAVHIALSSDPAVTTQDAQGTQAFLTTTLTSCGIAVSSESSIESVLDYAELTLSLESGTSPLVGFSSPRFLLAGHVDHVDALLRYVGALVDTSDQTVLCTFALTYPSVQALARYASLVGRCVFPHSGSAP